ncbi:hypothetical protein K0M31_018098 [Melipona bicolor]|uniref:Uncharacterized protein n=1 Tax=Melipona bicolor TaxID=60889 RepID=A0AA40FD58_9HYME|nr:hypothetical protein K0M31_018098 [Melipona bicolor]
MSGYIKTYKDIFHLSGDELSQTTLVKHSIETIDNLPVSTENYRYSESHKKEVDKQTNEMSDKGIIEESLTVQFSLMGYTITKEASGT